jgi:hypothetical protein
VLSFELPELLNAMASDVLPESRQEIRIFAAGEAMTPEREMHVGLPRRSM